MKKKVRAPKYAYGVDQITDAIGAGLNMIGNAAQGNQVTAGGVLSGIASGAMAGSQFGVPGAIVGGGLGLVTSTIGTGGSVNEQTYIVKLKENVKWHDDNNFTSEDVKFSIDRLQNQTESIFYQNVKNIKNVEVIDKYTIRIELKEEEAFFEYNLIFPIVSSKQYKNKSFNYTSTPVGTGKYKITKTENDKIELSRNDNWRDIDIENSNLKTIYINIYDSRGKEYNSFKLGSIDFIHTSSEESEEYIGSLGYNKKTYENREYDYLALNCKNTILQYQEIRQAISMIIDKEKIVASVLENKATIANYPLLNNYYLTVGLTKENKTNKTKAKEILENSGWNYEYGIWQKEIEGITKTINIDLVVSKENKKRIKVATELKAELEEFGLHKGVLRI